MKELIKFSLANRFYNKATILLNVMLLLLVGFIFTVDMVVLAGDPDFYRLPQLLISKEIMELEEWLLPELEKEYEIVRQATTEETRYLEIVDSKWQLSSTVAIAQAEADKLQALIRAAMQTYQNETYSSEVITEYQLIYDSYLSLNYIGEDDGLEKENLTFIVITGIYFMMLSYSAMLANEVVHEKTSRVLELILTSVTTRVHLLSKMMISWLTIMIQAGLLGVYILIALGLRFIYDYGSGMVRFLAKLNLLEEGLVNFVSVLNFYKISSETLMSLGWALIYLFLGILFVQLLLVIISSYVKSVEESASIQGPFYFFLLFVYYCSLSLTSQSQLNHGLGYIGSFVPFFSMLFMPARLIMAIVPLSEKVISFLLALLALLLVIYRGDKYYKQGILDNKPKKEKG